jgi:hypothetical protein
MRQLLLLREKNPNPQWLKLLVATKKEDPREKYLNMSFATSKIK